MVSVALYDTLGVAAVRHIIQQTKMPVIVASADKLNTVLTVAPDCPDLRLVISMDATYAGFGHTNAAWLRQR